LIKITAKNAKSYCQIQKRYCQILAELPPILGPALNYYFFLSVTEPDVRNTQKVFEGHQLPLSREQKSSDNNKISANFIGLILITLSINLLDLTSASDVAEYC
jgi:hypothetical protein